MNIDLSKLDNVEVLNRICDVYGFSQKVQLANHFGIAASSLSNRYRRGPISYDFATYCALETGASIEWLITGAGAKFTGQPVEIKTPDYVSIPNFTVSDSKMSENGFLNASDFLFGNKLHNPLSIKIDNHTYIVERDASLSDGSWLIDIDGAISIRELTILPGKKLHVGGGRVPFECSPDDINHIGRVVGIYSEVS